MTEMNLIGSGSRMYGTTPVSVFPSLVANIEKGMNLGERGCKVAETLYNPDIMTLDEFFSFTSEFAEEIHRIRYSRDKDNVKFLKKHNIPCAIISATVTSRSDTVPIPKKIGHYNGLVVLNIDNPENPEETKRVLSEIPYVFYAALSICGHGVFAIVPVETSDYNEHELYFNAVRNSLLEFGIVADHTGADVCRTRLASIDERPYRNDCCTVFCLNDVIGSQCIKHPSKANNMSKQGVSDTNCKTTRRQSSI